MPTINKRGIDTIMSLKKKIAAAFIACAMTLAVVPSAFACTALYVGSDLTEDGTTMSVSYTHLTLPTTLGV